MSPAGDVTAGGWQADDYARNARFVAELATDLLDWLAPRADERILDIGCGDGVLSSTIAESGAHVVGIDGSPAMAAAARERGIDTIEADAQCLAEIDTLGADFDAVFSNAALHWMAGNPQAVIDAVFDRLKPGGRFVAEMGGAGNIAPIHAALRVEAAERGIDPDRLDPWYFPSEPDYIHRLITAGFELDCHECFERPTRLPGDVTQWLTTLARPFVDAFAAGTERESYVSDVRARLVSLIQQPGGEWIAPYVRLRFIAYKPVA